jgi:GT2 family glycosyltransferase
MRTLVILVNWKQKKRTVESIRSIDIQLTSNDSIYIIDNNSGDDSVTYIKEHCPNVHVHENNCNIGFGQACNVGIEHAIKENYDFVLLLNNDGICAENFYSNLLLKLNSDSYAAIGAMVQDELGYCDPAYYLNPITLSPCATTDESTLNKKKYSWINAAAIIINLNVLKQVGIFSNEIFMYWEDVDLCSRIKSAGYKLGIADSAIFYHKAGTSSNSIPHIRHRWHFRSQLIWIRNNYKPKFYGLMIAYMRLIVVSLLKFDLKRLSLLLD